MNQYNLINLKLAVRTLLDDTFRSLDGPNLDTGEFEFPYPREVDLESFTAVVDEALIRFENQKPEKSDAWLAPRIHASLRITRREAANRELWAFLNISCRPQYVRWRYTATQGPSKGFVEMGRFIGEESRNAFGRLWWAAELTRNGADYSLTEQAMSSTRFSTSWQVLDTLHHKGFALACAQFLTKGNNGSPLSGTDSQRLAKAVNLCLRTTHIDAIVPSQLPDEIAIQDWVNSIPDYTQFLDTLPVGPDEDSVSQEDIDIFVNFLSDVATQVGVFDSSADEKSSEGEDVSESEEIVI